MSELIVELVAHLLDLSSDSSHPVLVLLEDLDEELAELALELGVDRRWRLLEEAAAARVGEVAEVWEEVRKVELLVGSRGRSDALLDRR